MPNDIPQHGICQTDRHLLRGWFVRVLNESLARWGNENIGVPKIMGVR